MNQIQHEDLEYIVNIISLIHDGWKNNLYIDVVESVRRGSTKWLVLLLIPAHPFKC